MSLFASPSQQWDRHWPLNRLWASALGWIQPGLTNASRLSCSHLLGCVLTADLSIAEQRQQISADFRFLESVLKCLWLNYSQNQVYRETLFSFKSCSTSSSLAYHAQNSQMFSSLTCETAPYLIARRGTSLVHQVIWQGKVSSLTLERLSTQHLPFSPKEGNTTASLPSFGFPSQTCLGCEEMPDTYNQKANTVPKTGGSNIAEYLLSNEISLE